MTEHRIQNQQAAELYIEQFALPPHFIVANYIQGRQTYVHFRGTQPKYRKVKQC